MRLGLGFGAHENRCDALVRADVDQVVDGQALRLALALRNLVHAQLEHAPTLGEEEHRGMGVGRQQVPRVVLLAGAAWSFAAGRGPSPFQTYSTTLLGSKHAEL